MDHPRIRGTNLRIDVPRTLSAGSPPHTRDKFEFAEDDSVDDRITPAYAGQIAACNLPDVKGRDHPRIRGTNT